MFSSIRTIRSAVLYNGGTLPLPAAPEDLINNFSKLAGELPTKTFVPISTVSGRSVVLRNVSMEC